VLIPSVNDLGEDERIPNTVRAYCSSAEIWRHPERATLAASAQVNTRQE